MRYFPFALVLGLMLALAGAGDARAAAWCAWSDPYTYNCGFRTFAQCEATISGAGGYCAPNVRNSWGGRPTRSSRY
jgi:hypothetical protein